MKSQKLTKASLFFCAVLILWKVVRSSYRITEVVGCGKSVVTRVYPFGCKIAEAKILRALIQMDSVKTNLERKHVFSSVGIDRSSSFHAALKVLSIPYNEPLDRGQIFQKVLALRFLRWTDQWAHGGDCIKLLRLMERGFAVTGSKQIRLNILGDASDVARVCAEVSKFEFKNYYTSIEAGVFKNQIALEGRLNGTK